MEKTTIKEREQDILDAAASLLIRFGYNKTTMSDIADEAGVTRAIVYLHFANKELLFEELLRCETLKYIDAMLQAFEADPQSGSFAALFRSVLQAIKKSPFMSAMMIEDRRFFGGYLTNPGNIFQSLQSSNIWQDTLKELQAVNAVRQDVDPFIMSHIMQALSIGLIHLEEDKNQRETPAFTDLLETIGDLVERMLLPEDAGNNEAGKAIIQRIVGASRQQFEQMTKPDDSQDSSKIARIISK